MAGIDEVVLVYAVVGSESLQQLKSFSYLFANAKNKLLRRKNFFFKLISYFIINIMQFNN